jgi:hypothetical protein
MTSLNIYTRFEMLPEHLKQEASDFIDFLTERSKAKKEKISPKPGSAKGKIHMSEDFDAPLDEFKDYM